MLYNTQTTLSSEFISTTRQQIHSLDFYHIALLLDSMHIILTCTLLLFEKVRMWMAEPESYDVSAYQYFSYSTYFEEFLGVHSASKNPTLDPVSLMKIYFCKNIRESRIVTIEWNYAQSMSIPVHLAFAK